MPFTTTEQQEIYALIGQYIAGQLDKKRIPELQPFTQYGDLSVNDLLALWMFNTNKTVHVPLGALAAFLSTGGSGTVTPVLKGDIIIHTVTAAEAGSNKIYEPSIAGMSFFLREEGRPVKPTEYNVLAAGGAEIFNEDGSPKELFEGQRFDLQVYEYSLGGQNPNTPTTGGAISGRVEVPMNTALSATDVNKLIQLRGGNTAITATLTDINTIDDFSYFIFEASIGNQKENTIATTGGQYIYMNGESYDKVHIRPGETAMVVKVVDGWYMVGQFSEIYNSVGLVLTRIQSPSAPLRNELIANGQLVNKADYPRLWAKVQASGDVLKNQTDWNTHKGMYLDYSSTQFGLPDYRDMVLKGASNTRVAGSFQPNQLPEHDHPQAIGDDGGSAKSYVMDSNNKQPSQTIDPNVRTGKAGTGTEVRVDTMGVLYTIKV